MPKEQPPQFHLMLNALQKPHHHVSLDTPVLDPFLDAQSFLSIEVRMNRPIVQRHVPFFA